MIVTIRIPLAQAYMAGFYKNGNRVVALTVDELAKKSGVSKNTIQKMITQGRMSEFSIKIPIASQIEKTSKAGLKYFINKTEAGYEISKPALAAWFKQEYL